MSEYKNKLQKYLESFRSRLKTLIEIHHNKGKDSYDYWLFFNANWNIYDAILESAKEQFTVYVTRDKEHALMMAGKAILYALQGYFARYNEGTFEEIWSFINMYIEKQHDDIREWCDIGTAMWDNEGSDSDEHTIPSNT